MLLVNFLSIVRLTKQILTILCGFHRRREYRSCFKIRKGLIFLLFHFYSELLFQVMTQTSLFSKRKPWLAITSMQEHSCSISENYTHFQ